MYPEDCTIDREDLIWRWIAEGFIVEVRGQTMEQVGENYFNELINRSWIQPVDTQYDGRAKYCRVHGVVLDLIISLSTEQNFVTTVNGQRRKSCFKKIRRISWFPSDDCEENETVQDITNSWSHVRSLIFHPRSWVIHPRMEVQIPLFPNLHALRVLVLESCTRLDKQNIESLACFFQLRYLNLSCIPVTELPKDIGRLQQIETLTLYRLKLQLLPGSVGGLQKLQRLIVDDSTTLPDEIGDLQALQVLSEVGRYNGTKFLIELGRLSRLRHLHIACYDIEDFEGDEVRFQSYKEAFYLTLKVLGKNSLRSLYVFCSICTSPPHLRELSIDGYCIPEISERIVSLTNLAYLDIVISSIDQRNLELLGGIPRLPYLQLYYNQVNGRITIGSGRFRCLKEFKIQNSGVHGLLFGPGAMPKLQSLSIHLFACEITASNLSSLQHLIVRVNCIFATMSHVQAVEDAIRNAASIHPGRPTLEMRRSHHHGNEDLKGVQKER